VKRQFGEANQSSDTKAFWPFFAQNAKAAGTKPAAFSKNFSLTSAF
jgi:hypothetical protein